MAKNINKISKKKTMIELEARDCKWPIGDPRHEDFHFCGAQQLLGRPYCAEHWAQAFMPSKPRTSTSSSAPALMIRRAA